MKTNDKEWNAFIAGVCFAVILVIYVIAIIIKLVR